MLLDHGANVNETFANLQTTALMTSSFHGHEKIVRMLLSRGANPRAVDMQGSTALGYAFGGMFLFLRPDEFVAVQLHFSSLTTSQECSR
jgi:hypothetical protein